LIGKEPMQQFNFSPHGDTVPVLFDTFDKLAEKYWSGVEDVVKDIDGFQSYFDKPVDKTLVLDMTMMGNRMMGGGMMGTFRGNRCALYRAQGWKLAAIQKHMRT
jgi:hypothetical protein